MNQCSNIRFDNLNSISTTDTIESTLSMVLFTFKNSHIDNRCNIIIMGGHCLQAGVSDFSYTENYSKYNNYLSDDDCKL